MGFLVVAISLLKFHYINLSNTSKIMGHQCNFIVIGIPAASERKQLTT